MRLLLLLAICGYMMSHPGTVFPTGNEPAAIRPSRPVAAAAVTDTRAAKWTKHTIVPPGSTGINSAVTVDADKDGNLDVITSFAGRVVLLQGPDWKVHTLHVFREGLSRNKPRPACIHSCVMDVDGDGDLDFCGSNNITFWLECPDEPLSGVPWTYRTIDDEILGTHCLISGDVNGDGRPDLIANSGRVEPDTAFPNSITWMEVPADPHTATAWIRHVFADRDAPGGSHYMGLGDVNGDGRPDITCAAKGGEGFPGGEWFAWWEQPVEDDGPWKKHLLADDQPGASNIHPVDLNGDGRLDFAATRGHAAGVLWFPAPDFQPQLIDMEIAGPHCLAVVDLDGDGDPDLATCGREQDGVAAWYQNDGHAHFQKHVIGTDQGAYDIRAVDMDRDGDLDLLIAGHTSNNVVWYQNPLHD